MPKPLDIVLFYNDFGRPYLPLIERMTKTAKEQMPHCRTVLLTMTPSAKLFRLFDHSIQIVQDADATRICYDKARAITTYQAQSDRNCVHTDPDVEFIKPVEFPDADVGLLWRKSKPAQPVNSGMIFARPGSPDFWKRYATTVASLPSALHSWWADQLAFSVMVGASLNEAGKHLRMHDADVLLMAEEDVCSAPEKVTDRAVAIHYKGIRKGIDFAPYFSKRAA